MIPCPSGDVSVGAACSRNKIYAGAKPADLPLDHATIIQMPVDLKSAKALGITLATAILVPEYKEIEQG